MYGDALIHRVLVFIGCLGLAALMPYGVLSIWLAIVLAVLPLAVLELGAGLVDHGEEKGSSKFRHAGYHVQAYGALLFITPLAVFTVAALRQRPPGWLTFLIVAVVGAPTCIMVILRWRHVLFGGEPSRPARHVDEAATPALRQRLSVMGAEPFLFGGIVFSLATLAAVAIVRGSIDSFGEMLLVVGLLAGAAMMAVAAGLDRWEERVPGANLGPAQDALQTLAVLSVTGSLLIGGLLWGGSNWLRFLLVALGGLSLASIILMGVRRVFKRPTPYKLRSLREGLLEQSRQGSIVYPWHTVLSCSLGQLGGNACLMLHVDDTEPISWMVAATSLGLGREKLLQGRRDSMQCNRQWLGVDLFALEDHLDHPIEAFARTVGAIIDGRPGAKDGLPSLSDLR